MRWPMGIAAGLLIVVAVNVAFIWIALDTAPEVDPDYVTGSRH